MTLSKVGHDRATFAGFRSVAHDLAVLRLGVELVRVARRGVHLEDTIAVEVAKLDFVNERVLLLVERFDPPFAVRAFAKHCDDALVMGGDSDVGRAVAVEVGHLGIAHAVEPPAEVRFPQRDRFPFVTAFPPELHLRRGAAE